MSATGFTFGAQPATQAQTPAFGGFSFGASTSTTSTPSFASSAFTGLSTNVSGANSAFGTTPATTTTNLFGTATPSLSTSFMPSTTTTMFPALGQTTVTSAPSTGFAFGGFGAANPSSSTATGFGLNSTLGSTTTTAGSVGLGGVDIQTSSGLDGTNSSGKKDSKAVKETLIPNEISVTIESFKKYVKEQKAIREEMSRVSSKNILRVQNQVANLRQMLSMVSNGLQRNAIAISKLKQESSEDLKNAEIAQRTKDTPPSLQYENTAPSEYFHNLAINFEHQMQSYRQQIEQLERHLLSLSQPSMLTPNELTVIIQRLHDTFVTLAAQLQTVHQQVQYHKEQFIAIQKVNHGDVSNIFELRKESAKELAASNHLPLPVTLGPSPVSAVPSAAAVAIANARNRTQQFRGGNLPLSMGGLNATGLGTGMTGGSFFNNTQPSLGSSFNLQNTSTFKPLGQIAVPSFGNSSLSGGTGFASENVPQSPYAANNQKPFQLQKPPAGNKRGKRWTST